MKKLFATVAILVLCAMLLMPTTAFANSAQREFQGVSSTGALVTGTDCPVTVTSERLTFNIGSFPSMIFDSDDWASYSANVTAEYTFYNPADYDVNMQLVFPFGRIPYWLGDNFVDEDKYSVYINGDKVERGLRATFSRYGSFDLSNDLPRIRDEREPIATMPDSLPVYKYSVQSEFVNDYTSYTLVARYKIDNFAIIVPNDVSYTNVYDGNDCCNIYGSDKIIIYSIGRQLPDSFFKPTYYVQASEEVNRHSGEVSYNEYEVSGSTSYQLLEELTFEDLIFINYNEESGISRDDYYNAITDKLYIVNFNNYVHDTQLFDLTNQLMLWYSYDVGIPAGQSVTNTVVAPLYPTINEYYTPTKYSYEYLLSPAASWASFANLDITVNTSVYMMDSSLEGFKKTANGYTAHFDSLPEGEFTFSLCMSEKPEYNDNYGSFATFMWILFGILIFVGIVIVVDLLAVAIVVPIVVTKSRNKRARQQQSTADSTACVVQQADNSANACLPDGTTDADAEENK